MSDLLSQVRAAFEGGNGAPRRGNEPDRLLGTGPHGYRNAAADPHELPVFGEALWPLSASGDPGRPNSAAADIYRMRITVNRLLGLDNRYGGDALAPTAVRTWRAGRRKLDSGAVPGSLRSEYLTVLSEVAQVAGWLLFDAGRHRESRAAFLDSHMLAHHAGDRAMGWFARDMLALHGVEHHRPDEAFRIADGTASGMRVPPRVALLARIRKGRALASMGCRQQAVRELTAARSALSDSTVARDPSWAWWVDDRELSGHEGEALLALGEPSAAIPRLRHALVRAEESANRRAALHYSIDLLKAYAAGQLWRECESTLLALPPLLQAVGSGRSRHRLRAALRDMARASGAPDWLWESMREVAAAPRVAGG